MVKGEWLLTNHKDHLSLYNTLQKRRDQCIQNLQESDEQIEGMALKGIAFDDNRSIASRGFGSQTEHIALSYETKNAKIRHEFSEEIYRLEEQLHNLRRYLNLFDAIMAGLDAKEAWIITEHCVSGKAIDTLSKEKDPKGIIYSPSTLRRLMKRVFVKADRLFLAMQGDIDIDKMELA